MLNFIAAKFNLFTVLNVWSLQTVAKGSKESEDRIHGICKTAHVNYCRGLG